MKLPNGKNAVVDIKKLRDYCLNSVHPRGRHKARVFTSVLGITSENAEQLREFLLEAAAESEAILVEKDQYGQRYVIDYNMAGLAGEASVRSLWIVRFSEDFPRLTSCYVL